ncbi:hypothetical protein LINGRAPRIM_LOCUS1806 [Linum grandiflorum]
MNPGICSIDRTEVRAVVTGL